MTSSRDLVARLGFDLPKLAESLWLLATAFAAMVLAWSFGFDHPQWAAITVFVTVQPSRGQTIEKSAFRFVGTLAGSGVGLLLVTLSGGHPVIIATGLALWSGACLFLGTLLRSYRSYATVLAGYSAIIVAMSGSGPAEALKLAALDRVAAIMIGIVAGIALSYVIGAKANRSELEQKSRRIVADMLAQAEANLARNGLAQPTRNFQLTTAAAELSSEFLSLSSRRAGAHALTDPLNDLLVCAANFMLATARAKASPDLAAVVGSLATRLHAQDDFAGLHRSLSRAIALTDDPILHDALLALSAAAPEDEGDDRGLTLAPFEGLHWQYDWRSAWQAALRILIVTAGFGLVWAISGASVVQFGMISAAIVISLASSGVSPSRAMRDVVIGQVIGALAALGCETLLWDRGLGGVLQIAATVPVFLLYAPIRSHRRLSLSATDYALTLLLLLSPTHAAYEAAHSAPLKAALAISGGICGYLAFRLLFPVDATRRRKGLWLMIKREVQEIAVAAPGRAGSANGWRLRFVSRFMRIVGWTFHEAHRRERPEITMRKGLLTLALGDLVFAARAASRNASTPHDLRRAIGLLLRRIATSDRENAKLDRGLELLRRRLAATPFPAAMGVEPMIAHLLDLCTETIAQIEDLRRMRTSSSSPE